MAKFRLAKKKKGGGNRILMAVAGFAVICGLVLLIAGAPGLGCNPSAPGASIDVLSALRSINKADSDLERGNYGNARARVKDAQEALTRALRRLHATVDDKPDRAGD